MNKRSKHMTPLDHAYDEAHDAGMFASRYLREVNLMINRFNVTQVAELIDMFSSCRFRDSDIYFAGNGGKTALCAEWVNDLTVALPLKPFRAHSVMERVASLTAASNDYGWESAIWRILQPLVRFDDVVVLISGSGNSPNMLYAAEAARRNEITLVGIGRKNGQLETMVDLFVEVPALDDGPTEDAIMMLLHICHAWFLREVKK